jgi:hypothetical protein
MVKSKKVLPKQQKHTYNLDDIPDDLKYDPRLSAIGQIAYQEHSSGDMLPDYVVLGQVRNIAHFTTFTVEQVAPRQQPTTANAIQRAEHCRRNVSFYHARECQISIDAVKLLQVKLPKDDLENKVSKPK